MLVVVCQMIGVELLKDWMKVKAVGWWSQLTEQTTGSSTQLAALGSILICQWPFH